MIQIFYFVAGFACFCFIMLIYFFFLLRHEKAEMQRRSAAMVNPYLGVLDERTNPASKTMDGFSTAFGTIRTKIGGKQNESIKKRLISAGFRDPRAQDVFFGLRLTLPLIGIAIATFCSMNPMMMLIGAVVGYMAPDYVLVRLVKKRLKALRLSIPDAVDLMVICMDAGHGIDQAVRRTSEVLHISYPELCEELLETTRLQSMNVPRNDAWKTMVERTKSPELDQVANMLYQSEVYGTPVSEGLRILGDSLRVQRKQRAEEKAAKSGIYMLLPLVLFIFPSIFVVLLGPAALSILRAFSNMGH